MLCLPSTSEDTGVLVTSSPELYIDPKLAPLDGKNKGVTCSSRQCPWAHNLREHFVQPIDQNVLQNVDRRHYHWAREIVEKVRVVEVEEAGQL